MAKICGHLSGGRICRRKPGHEGDHAYGLLRAPRRKPNLELAATASDLVRFLPEGDYTHLVERVYINGRVVMIEFNTSNVDQLISQRKRG